MGLPKLLDVLGLHSIDPGHLAISSINAVQNMIELRMQRLCVAVLSPLNEEGHHPGRERCYGMPIEGVAGKKEPSRDVGDHDEECCRARCQHAEMGKAVAD